MKTTTLEEIKNMVKRLTMGASDEIRITGDATRAAEQYAKENGNLRVWGDTHTVEGYTVVNVTTDENAQHIISFVSPEQP